MGRCIALLVLLAAAACAPAPQRAGVPTLWTPSPNADERRPNHVILHHTTHATAGEALATLTHPARGVSAHYLVTREGVIHQLVDERRRAWHAGESSWGGNTDLNSSSIGIELDNTGAEPYPPAQVAALLGLLADLKARYKIPARNFLAHGDVAPGRKVDPGALFPWALLAAHGFGAWCDDASPYAGIATDPVVALQALGYDVADPGAAVRAFNRRYLQREDDGTLDEAALATLHCLVDASRAAR